MPIDTAVETLTDEANHAGTLCRYFCAHAYRFSLRAADCHSHVRTINPSAHICFYGLYALLNADYLLRDTIDSAIGGRI